MINPASVAFDFDGVIADTMTLFLEIARSEFCIHGIHYEDITCYSLANCLDVDPDILKAIAVKIMDGDYEHPLKSIKGASEALIRLVRYRNPLLLVTARPYLGPVGDWVRDNISLPPHQVEVVTTGSFENKAMVLLEKKITHFVEDRLETCFVLREAGIEPILFKQPWNRQPHGFVEVGSWAELVGLIDFPGAGEG